MSKLIYPERTYQIIGLCMEVHRILGPGLLEVVYKDALEYEFKQNGIPYEREKKYEVIYKDQILRHSYFADFVVFDEILLEAKATEGIHSRFVAWTLHYMHVAKSPVGLIVNFGVESLQHKRLAL
jgi:GxxExxY protein